MGTNLNFHVHLHIQIPTESSGSGKDSKLIIKKLEEMANKLEQFTERVNSATNAIAAKLQQAKDEITQAIANQGLSLGEETAGFETLNSAITQLEAIGADPSNPLPNEETPVTDEEGQDTGGGTTEETGNTTEETP